MSGGLKKKKPREPATRKRTKGRGGGVGGGGKILPAGNSESTIGKSRIAKVGNGEGTGKNPSINARKSRVLH